MTLTTTTGATLSITGERAGLSDPGSPGGRPAGRRARDARAPRRRRGQRLRHLRAPGHRVRLSGDERAGSSNGLEGLAAWPGTHRAAGWRSATGRQATAGDTDRRVPAGVGHQAAHGHGGARRRAGGDRGPRRAGRPARLHRATAAVPRVGASLRGPRAGRRRRADGASTATPPSSVLAELVSDRSQRPVRRLRAGGGARAARDGRHARSAAPPRTAPQSTLDDLLRFAGELLDAGPRPRPGAARRGDHPAAPGPGRGPARVRPAAPQPVGSRVRDQGRQGAALDPTGGVARARSATSGSPGRSSGSIRTPGVACAGLSDQPFGDWAVAAWPALGSAVLTRAAIGPFGPCAWALRTCTIRSCQLMTTAKGRVRAGAR